jgi:hypothetical protein
MPAAIVLSVRWLEGRDEVLRSLRCQERDRAAG